MKKHIYKTMAAMLLLSLISAPFSPASKVYSAENILPLNKDIGFKFDGTDWTYLGALGQKMTGWVTGTDGNKYYLDPVTGKLHTGWLKADGNWYFLNTVSDGTKGKLMTGWQWIDGYCYYFDKTGKMSFSTNTPDGYYVNVNGQWAEHDGTVHFISGKGFDTVHVLGAARTIPVTSRIVTGSSGGSGGSGRSGSSGSNGSENRDSGNAEKKEPKNNTEKEPENSTKDNKDKENKPETKPGTKPESKPESKDKPDSKPEDTNETKPEIKPGDGSKKDPETKTDKKRVVKVSGFKAIKPLKIPYQGDRNSTIAFIKKKLKNSGVTFYLSNGKRTTAVVTDWKIDGTAEIGNTIIAKPEALKIPDSYKDIKAQFEKLDIEEKISIVKGKAQEEETTAPAETAESQTETPTEAPTEEETTKAPGEEETTAAPENQHPDNWAITGYIEPDKLELEYIDNDINSYKQYFPKTVTFLTNDGTKITIDAKWNGYDRPPAAGREIKINCQNGYEDLPSDIRYILMDSFETVGTPELVIKFKAEESNKKEPDISLDRAPFEKATYDKYRYRLQESMTIEFLNYTGDGTDVVIKGRGFEKKLSELSYDPETKKVTVIVKDLVPNGYYGNSFYLNVTIGKKTIWKQIYVDTD